VFSHLLQQATSPFAEISIGKRPVLVIDALNECSEAFRPKLLEKLQAFVLLRGARLVMSDQGPAELPPEIKSIPISVQLPEGDETVRIFSYYAGEPPSDGLAHLSRNFTNAFDLKIAGKSHARGNHPDSRWELYSRYVRDTLEGTYIVASAFLRAIAGEMMESLTMAIRRDRFEKLAEIFYQEEHATFCAGVSLIHVLPHVLNGLGGPHLIELPQSGGHSRKSVNLAHKLSPKA
jgi:hypothetical protein